MEYRAESSSPPPPTLALMQQRSRTPVTQVRARPSDALNISTGRGGATVRDSGGASDAAPRHLFCGSDGAAGYAGLSPLPPPAGGGHKNYCGRTPWQPDAPAPAPRCNSPSDDDDGLGCAPVKPRRRLAQLRVGATWRGGGGSSAAAGASRIATPPPHAALDAADTAAAARASQPVGTSASPLLGELRRLRVQSVTFRDTPMGAGILAPAAASDATSGARPSGQSLGSNASASAAAAAAVKKSLLDDFRDAGSSDPSAAIASPLSSCADVAGHGSAPTPATGAGRSWPTAIAPLAFAAPSHSGVGDDDAPALRGSRLGLEPHASPLPAHMAEAALRGATVTLLHDDDYYLHDGVADGDGVCRLSGTILSRSSLDGRGASWGRLPSVPGEPAIFRPLRFDGEGDAQLAYFSASDCDSPDGGGGGGGRMRKVAVGAMRGAWMGGGRRRGVVPLPRPALVRGDGWGCGEGACGRRFGSASQHQHQAQLQLPIAAGSSLQCALAGAAARGCAGDVAMAPGAYAEFRPTKVRRVEDAASYDENTLPQPF